MSTLDAYVKMISQCIEATGKAVAGGAVSPDKAPSFMADLTHTAWMLIEEARKTAYSE